MNLDRSDKTFPFNLFIKMLRNLCPMLIPVLLRFSSFGRQVVDNLNLSGNRTSVVNVTFHFQFSVCGNSVDVRIRVNQDQMVFVRFIGDQSINVLSCAFLAKFLAHSAASTHSWGNKGKCESTINEPPIELIVSGIFPKKPARRKSAR